MAHACELLMRMMKRLLFILALAATLVSTGVSQNQTPSPDLAGVWELSMRAFLPNQATCDFEGSAQVTQMDGMVRGTATQRLTLGSPQSCPPTMTADLMGTLVGSRLTGTLDGGVQFGTASFEGTVGPSGMSLTGTFSTSPNGESTAIAKIAPAGPPFPGINGNWQGQVQAAREIPVLSGPAIAALVALLLLASFGLLQRSAA